MRYARSEVYDNVRQPYFRFFPSDWRGDQDLRNCSLQARGLWVELMALMHTADPYGHLVIGGFRYNVSNVAELATNVGCQPADFKRAFAELAKFHVFSIAEDGTIYSRRMVRDAEKAESDRLNGKTGGNPRIIAPDKSVVKTGVNPLDKPRDKARTRTPFGGGVGDSSSDVLDSEETSPCATSPAFDLALAVIGRGLEADVIEAHLALDVHAAAYRQLGSAETLLAAYGHDAVMDRVELYIAAYRVGKMIRRLSCLTVLETWGWDNVWSPEASKAKSTPELSDAGKAGLAAIEAREIAAAARKAAVSA